MAGQVDVAKSTEAKFVPEDRKGLHKPNSIEWMLMVTGIAICASALGRSWSGWRSFSPHSTAAFSSDADQPWTLFRLLPALRRFDVGDHYQEKLDCPSCQGMVRIHNGRYEAI